MSFKKVIDELLNDIPSREEFSPYGGLRDELYTAINAANLHYARSILSDLIQRCYHKNTELWALYSRVDDLINNIRNNDGN